MRALKIVCLVLVSCQSLLGQTDTNLVAIGDWSTPVADSDGYVLRGRLLVARPLPPKTVGRNRDRFVPHARVYLELEHVFDGAWHAPLEIYFDPVKDMRFSMHDSVGDEITPEPMMIRGPVPRPSWVSVPCDARLRLRADLRMGTHNGRDDALTIGTMPGVWTIAPGSLHEYFLSGHFTATTDRTNAFLYHQWHGTLDLPKTRIPKEWQ